MSFEEFFNCPGALEGSTGSGSGFKASQKTGPRFKVSSDRLEEPVFEFRTPWTLFIFNFSSKRKKGTITPVVLLVIF